MSCSVVDIPVLVASFLALLQNSCWKADAASLPARRSGAVDRSGGGAVATPLVRGSSGGLVFCPPLLGAGNASGEAGQRRCLARIRGGAFHRSLQHASATLRLLWIAALHQHERPHAPRRYAAYWKLLETVRQLECVGLFGGCFPNGVEDERRAAATLCHLLRSEVSEASRLDAAMGIFGDLSADKAFDSNSVPASTFEGDTEGHPCYDRDAVPPSSAGIASLGAIVPYDRLTRLHAAIRWRAVAPADAQLLRTIADISHRAFDLAFGPYDPTLPGVTTIPELRTPSAHTPGGICGRPGLPRWQEAFNISTMLAALDPRRRGWVVNVGAGDGACLERRFGESVDPASCLILREGRGGVMFEGSPDVRRMLLRRFGGRADVALHLSYAGPGEVARAVERYAGRAASDAPVDLVKVDVDNCDCCFLESILAVLRTRRGLQPRFIHVEVHSLVPPPIVFRPLAFDRRVRSSLEELGPRDGRRGHMLHCSLSAFVELLRPLGYELLRVYHFDAVFVDVKVAERLRRLGRLKVRRGIGQVQNSSEVQELWLGGFFCQPLRTANLVEITYEASFLYDFRRWCDPRTPLLERVGLVQAYLDHWRIPRSRFALGVELES
eukprot:TRINITY_DN14065_c0_g1_i1.p1 TRINITY_DN14065_c0_g1~~TRINITY_DN14065_c0_g1_i1.p1  ORF type:complete len:611 (-),score=70.69 TRINITY_DN14065_c0_g1_i1:36-1868(-)